MLPDYVRTGRVNVYKPLPIYPTIAVEALHSREAIYSNRSAHSEPGLSTSERVASPRTYSSVSFLEEYFAMIEESDASGPAESYPSSHIHEAANDVHELEAIQTGYGLSSLQHTTSEVARSEPGSSMSLSKGNLDPFSSLTPLSVPQRNCISISRKTRPPSLSLTNSEISGTIHTTSQASLMSNIEGSPIDTDASSIFSDPAVDWYNKAQKRKGQSISPSLPSATSGISEEGGRLRRFARAKRAKIQRCLQSEPPISAKSTEFVLASEYRSTYGPDTPFPRNLPESPSAKGFAKITIPFYQSTCHLRRALHKVKNDVASATINRKRERLKKSIVMVNQPQPTGFSNAGSTYWI